MQRIFFLLINFLIIFVVNTANADSTYVFQGSSDLEGAGAVYNSDCVDISKPRGQSIPFAFDLSIHLVSDSECALRKPDPRSDPYLTTIILHKNNQPGIQYGVVIVRDRVIIAKAAYPGFAIDFSGNTFFVRKA